MFPKKKEVFPPNHPILNRVFQKFSPSILGEQKSDFWKHPDQSALSLSLFRRGRQRRHPSTPLWLENSFAAPQPAARPEKPRLPCSSLLFPASWNCILRGGLLRVTVVRPHLQLQDCHGSLRRFTVHRETKSPQQSPMSQAATCHRCQTAPQNVP